MSTTNEADKIPVLYVEKKEKGTLAITATPEPGAEWPVDGETKYPIWSGSGGAVDSKDPAKYVLALDTAGSYTISASCGNTVSVKVVVIELLHEALEEVPANRKRLKYGLGEEIKLWTEPKAPNTAEWVINGQSYSYEKFNKVVLKLPENPGKVSFAIKINKSLTLSREFSIVAPDGVLFELIPNLSWHQQGLPSAGAACKIYLTPSDVSFKFIMIWEGDCGVTDAKGYCVRNSSPHLGQRTDNGDPLLVRSLSVVEGKGSDLGVDNAYFVGKYPSVEPLSDGSFSWNIPWYYYTQSNYPNGQKFTTIAEQFKVTATGTVTVSKGGVTVSADLDDPSGPNKPQK